MQWLGVEVGDISPGVVEYLLNPRDETIQHGGVVHGANIGGLADNVAGAAGGTLTVPDAAPVIIEYKINFMKPVPQAPMRARGEVIRLGRDIIVPQADIFSLAGGEEALCATLLGTFRPVPLG